MGMPVPHLATVTMTAAILTAALCGGAAMAQDAGGPAMIAEALPDSLRERMLRKEQKLRDAIVQQGLGADPRLVIFRDKKWPTGKTITVAFKGGDSKLHERIAQVASEWTLHANITFDFGRDAAGNYRAWTDTDGDYAADIRIGFGERGNWSAVGIGAIDPDVRQPFDATMNFQDFDKQLPRAWQRTVRHEFGHALGLEHEHQHPKVDCGWRWDDDDGYEPTLDKHGQYVKDAQGRRPGLFTVMSGNPNKWSKHTVKFNLERFANEQAYGFGPFDKFSIMKYSYEAWMFREGENSPCYTTSPTLSLSPEDKARIALYYPMDPVVAATDMQMHSELVTQLLSEVGAAPELVRELKARQRLNASAAR